MSKGSQDNLKAWVQAWQRAGERLEELRKTEIRQVDTASAIRALASNFSWAMRTIPLRKHSGLVEQQRLFAKLRKS